VEYLPFDEASDNQKLFKGKDKVFIGKNIKERIGLFLLLKLIIGIEKSYR